MKKRNVITRDEDYRISATVVAQALIDEGVTDMFGIPGGTNDHVLQEGHGTLKGYVVRHEQTAAFAADAYARCLRKPGVCYTSGSPGSANAYAGMMHARGANSPVVQICGGGATETDGLNNMQNMDLNPAKSLEGVCKMTKRITDVNTSSYWIRKAFQVAMAPVQGPTCIEMPIRCATAVDDGNNLNQKLYAPGQPSHIPGCAGDPAVVQKAVEMLLDAKRPLVVCGDDAYWSHAGADLRELAELIQVPVTGKRTARGIVAEDDPYGCSPAAMGSLAKNADVICLIGNTFSSMENWFQPPNYPASAKYIQIAPTATDIWLNLPALNIVGSSRLVVRQMIECAREIMHKDHSNAEWMAAVQKAKATTRMFVDKGNQRYHGKKPMHTGVICEAIGKIMDDSSTLIYDSLSASSFMTQQVNAKYGGQVLDAGIFQTLGHSIGMCIGAQVARPGRQVLTVVGDGGFGISGMDMETMARYNLPAVVVLVNNSSWGGRCWGPDIYYPKMPSQRMLPDMRYDIAFREFGCHTELVTEDEQMLPALERAFNSGKPALINCIAETDSLHPIRKHTNLGDIIISRNVDTLPDEALCELATFTEKDLVKAQKQLFNNDGAYYTIEEFQSIIDYAKEHCSKKPV